MSWPPKMNRNWSITSSSAVTGATERIEGKCILLILLFYCATVMFYCLYLYVIVHVLLYCIVF